MYDIRGELRITKHKRILNLSASQWTYHEQLDWNRNFDDFHDLWISVDESSGQVQHGNTNQRNNQRGNVDALNVGEDVEIYLKHISRVTADIVLLCNKSHLHKLD